MKTFSLATVAGALLFTSSSAFADPCGPARFGPRDDFHLRGEPVPPAFFDRGPRGRFGHRHLEPPFDLRSPRREIVVERAAPRPPVVNVTPMPASSPAASSPRAPSNSPGSAKPKPASQGGSGQPQPKPAGQGSGSTRPPRSAS